MLIPWALFGLTESIRLLPGVEGSNDKAWFMFGLCCVFTPLWLAVWQPWKREDG
jgi:hypothetical protein